MLNVNNSSPSFKANIRTNLKGRNNIVETISKRFSEISKDIPGTMEIARASKDYPGCLEFKLAGKGPSYLMTNYQQFFGIEPKKVTTEKIDDTATKFVKLFRLLTEEKEYTKRNTDIKDYIESATKSLKENSFKLKVIKENNKNSSFVKIYETLVNNNKKRIENLKHRKFVYNYKMNQKFKQIADNDPFFDTYLSILKDLY